MASKKRYYDKAKGKSDGQMISGATGIANMPTEVVMKYYPKDGPYFSYDLNDGMSGISKQKSADVNKAKSQRPDSKY